MAACSRHLTLNQPFLGASPLAPPPGKEACSSRVAAPLILETATAGTILVSPDFGDVSCDYAAMDAGGQLVADAHIFILFIHLCSRQRAPPPASSGNPKELPNMKSFGAVGGFVSAHHRVHLIPPQTRENPMGSECSLDLLQQHPDWKKPA